MTYGDVGEKMDKTLQYVSEIVCSAMQMSKQFPEEKADEELVKLVIETTTAVCIMCSIFHEIGDIDLSARDILKTCLNTIKEK